MGLGIEDVPWPPDGCPVSGMQMGECEDARKQRLKLALLRWHPDKFEARHGPKLLEAAMPAIMARVSATLQRLQIERDRSSGGAGETGCSSRSHGQRPATGQAAMAHPSPHPSPPLPPECLPPPPLPLSPCPPTPLPLPPLSTNFPYRTTPYHHTIPHCNASQHTYRIALHRNSPRHITT